MACSSIKIEAVFAKNLAPIILISANTTLFAKCGMQKSVNLVL